MPMPNFALEQYVISSRDIFLISSSRIRKVHTILLWSNRFGTSDGLWDVQRRTRYFKTVLRWFPDGFRGTLRCYSRPNPPMWCVRCSISFRPHQQNVFFHEVRGLARSTRGRLQKLNQRCCMHLDAFFLQTAIEQTSKLTQPGAIHSM